MKQNETKQIDKPASSSDMGCLFILMLILIVMTCTHMRQDKIDEIQKINSSLEDQNRRLESSLQSLDKIDKYLEQQQNDADEKVSEMKTEISRLRELQKIDQDIANRLFAEEEKRRKREDWIGWIVGGVVGTIIGFLFERLRNIFRRKPTGQT